MHAISDNHLDFPTKRIEPKDSKRGNVLTSYAMSIFYLLSRDSGYHKAFQNHERSVQAPTITQSNTTSKTRTPPQRANAEMEVAAFAAGRREMICGAPTSVSKFRRYSGQSSRLLGRADLGNCAIIWRKSSSSHRAKNRLMASCSVSDGVSTDSKRNLPASRSSPILSKTDASVREISRGISVSSKA